MKNPPTENKSKKGRVWEIDLYPDCDRHLEILAQLAESPRAVGILHNRDINGEGAPKKPHFHWLYVFDNPVGQGSVEKLFPDLESNLIQAVNSTKGAYRYLIHLDNPEKAQYSKSELIGNITLAEKYLRTENDEPTEVILLLDMLESNPNMTIAQLMRYACKNGLYGAFRRNAYILHQIAKEKKQCTTM